MKLRRPKLIALLLGIFVACVLVAAMVSYYRRFPSFVVPTRDMEPTISQNARIRVDTVTGPIDCGDIVVIPSPDDHGTFYVKRVVGVSGDELEIRSKKLFRNGNEVEESYAIHSDERIVPSRSPLAWRDHLPLTAVPAGYLFVMGDNRDVSADSRLWGPIPAHSVVGRVVEILEAW